MARTEHGQKLDIHKNNTIIEMHLKIYTVSAVSMDLFFFLFCHVQSHALTEYRAVRKSSGITRPYKPGYRTLTSNNRDCLPREKRIQPEIQMITKIASLTTAYLSIQHSVTSNQYCTTSTSSCLPEDRILPPSRHRHDSETHKRHLALRLQGHKRQCSVLLLGTQPPAAGW